MTTHPQPWSHHHWGGIKWRDSVTWATHRKPAISSPRGLKQTYWFPLKNAQVEELMLLKNRDVIIPKIVFTRTSHLFIPFRLIDKIMFSHKINNVPYLSSICPVWSHAQKVILGGKGCPLIMFLCVSWKVIDKCFIGLWKEGVPHCFPVQVSDPDSRFVFSFISLWPQSGTRQPT